MFCSNCGAEQPEGTNFCSVCGQSLLVERPPDLGNASGDAASDPAASMRRVVEGTLDIAPEAGLADAWSNWLGAEKKSAGSDDEFARIQTLYAQVRASRAGSISLPLRTE